MPDISSKDNLINTEAILTPASRNPSLLTNAISNWGPLGVNLVIGFLLIPYLINNLGKTQYGIWFLVNSFIGYYGLLRLGVGAGIMRYVPFYRGINNPKAASQTASTAMAVFLIASLTILLISLLLAEPIARFYKGGPQLALLIRILGITAAFECPFYIFDGCIRANEHWVPANSVSMAISVIRAIGLAACVYWRYGVVQMGYVTFAVTILSMIWIMLLFKRFCPTIHLRPSLVSLSTAKMLISFGLLTTIITIVYSLTLQGHHLIIGKLISLDAVTLYAIPTTLILNARGVLIAPARVFWTRFAYLDGKNHTDGIASLFLRGTKYTAIFGSAVMFVIFVAGPPFIQIWVGKDFQAAHLVLMVLAAGYLIESSQAIIGPLLGGTGRQAAQATFAIIEGIMGLGLSLILTLKMGMVGTALGFLIGAILIRGIIFPFYTCRLLQIKLLQYYTGYIMRPWLILLVLTVIVYAMGLPAYIQNWATFIPFALTSTLLFAISAYLLAMNREEKKECLYFVRTLLARIPKLNTIIKN